MPPENDPHHLSAVIQAKSPVFIVLSSRPIGKAHPLATPASRRLLTLMLPRLRTRGSLMRSFRDSARRRSAEVRLKMARRPRREDDRVGTAASPVGHSVAKSLVLRFANGGDEYRGDTALRDETLGTVAEEKYLACRRIPFRRAVSMPRGGVEVDFGKLVASSLPFARTTEVVSTR